MLFQSVIKDLKTTFCTFCLRSWIGNQLILWATKIHLIIIHFIWKYFRLVYCFLCTLLLEWVCAKHLYFWYAFYTKRTRQLSSQQALTIQMKRKREYGFITLWQPDSEINDEVNCVWFRLKVFDFISHNMNVTCQWG